MDQEIAKKFEEQDAKLEAIYKSTEKTRKYILWYLIIMVGTIVLPMIALVFMIPWFLKTMSSVYGGLSL